MIIPYMHDNLTLEASSLFRQAFGAQPSLCVRLDGAGSDSIYWRLSGAGRSVIATYGRDKAENEAFVALARIFRGQGINVPEIYAVSPDGLIYLQQDLGDTQLLSLLSTDSCRELVEATLGQLVAMQTVPAPLWERDVTAKPFGPRLVAWDLNYFKYEFLKPAGVLFDEERLQDDFDRLSADLLAASAVQAGFMMRDCQSRNVMIADGAPYMIDFQGGRKGPGLYDAVSLLWQAKAGFAPEFRKMMLSRYVALLADATGADAALLADAAPLFVLFRTLQVLGAYGFRGLVEHKAHFVESIPAAVRNLSELLEGGVADSYPELRRAAAAVVSDERFRAPERGRLIVKVFSFSYKRGYPEDLTGNGGGFMFDCRAMHNPGRYAEYKPLTGLDAPVREFLEERGEVQPFIAAAAQLVDPAVKRYIERGFSSLQIGFGCTGGRHRSVFCAEATARRLAGAFPEAEIRLIHREQGIERVFRGGKEVAS